MAHPEKFYVRLASLEAHDAQFIIAAFDSTLPHLAAIGSAEMWGEQLFSERQGFAQETIKSVQESQDPDSASKIFIAETQKTAERVRVGSATVREDSMPAYIIEHEKMKPYVQGGNNFLFLEVIIADYRTDGLHKGVGTCLLEYIQRYGRERSKKTLYVDCWSGNGGKLNRYYEKQGFEKVADFSFPRIVNDSHSIAHEDIDLRE
ncbi:hypothetical protein ACQRIU_001134 [Beauveria bassiana]